MVIFIFLLLYLYKQALVYFHDYSITSKNSILLPSKNTDKAKLSLSYFLTSLKKSAPLGIRYFLVCELK